MEKNVILTSRQNVNLSLSEAIAQTAVVRNLAEIFSAIMEEEVTPQHTLLIVNAMMSLFMLVFPIYSSIALRIICFAWFLVAILQCKKAGMDKVNS